MRKGSMTTTKEEVTTNLTTEAPETVRSSGIWTIEYEGNKKTT